MNWLTLLVLRESTQIQQVVAGCFNVIKNMCMKAETKKHHRVLLIPRDQDSKCLSKTVVVKVLEVAMLRSVNVSQCTFFFARLTKKLEKICLKCLDSNV